MKFHSKYTWRTNIIAKVMCQKFWKIGLNNLFEYNSLNICCHLPVANISWIEGWLFDSIYWEYSVKIRAWLYSCSWKLSSVRRLFSPDAGFVPVFLHVYPHSHFLALHTGDWLISNINKNLIKSLFKLFQCNWQIPCYIIVNINLLDNILLRVARKLLIPRK